MIFCLFGVEMKIGISFSFSEFKFNPAGACALKSELVSIGYNQLRLNIIV